MPARSLALAAAAGSGVGASLYRSQNYLVDFETLYGRIGPAQRTGAVRSAGPTPEFLAAAPKRSERVAISGWDGGQDSALTDRTAGVPEILGR